MASAASCKWCSRRLAPAPELLMLNPWRVLSSELIYDRIWGYDYGAAANGLRVYIGYPR